MTEARTLEPGERSSEREARGGNFAAVPVPPDPTDRREPKAKPQAKPRAKAKKAPKTTIPIFGDDEPTALPPPPPPSPEPAKPERPRLPPEPVYNITDWAPNAH